MTLTLFKRFLQVTHISHAFIAIIKDMCQDSVLIKKGISKAKFVWVPKSTKLFSKTN